MKPVYLRGPALLPLSKAVVFFFLIITLVACGANPATISSPAKSHPSSTTNKPTKTPTAIPTASPSALKTPTAIPTASPTAFNPNALNVSEEIGSLRIHSDAGFQCPNDPAVGFGVQDQLIFTSDPTTYNQDEIAQIRSYMQTAGGAGEPPPTLRWVLGGSVDRISGAETDNLKYYVPCGVKLTLTNMGSTSIQIPQVGVQLEGPPEENTYQYRLVDACSLGALPPCPPLGGAGNTCSIYVASIQLGLGEEGAEYSAVPMGIYGSNCGTLTIAPNAQVDLILTFSLATNIPKNLIYSILPTFTVDTAQGMQTLPLPQLASTLAFASANQFSCYTLQGTAFVLLKSPSAPPNWCM